MTAYHYLLSNETAKYTNLFTSVTFELWDALKFIKAFAWVNIKRITVPIFFHTAPLRKCSTVSHVCNQF